MEIQLQGSKVMNVLHIVELELKIELKEDMRAASMTDIIKPLAPEGIKSVTNLMNARFVHPLLEENPPYTYIILLLNGLMCIVLAK